jgi:predicted DNA-binding transcriptional regulator AlpA
VNLQDRYATYLTPEDLAEKWGLTLDTLYRWRRRGAGPPHLKINSRVIRYRLEDVLAWEDSRRVDQTGGTR